jgi:antirestriction protein ArdC
MTKATTTPKAAKPDLYTQITERILAAMDAGTAPWQRPWKELARRGLPRNGASQRAYSGINTTLLQVEAIQHGYDDNRWFTFNQANQAGARVRKGEKSTSVYFFKLLDRPNDKDAEPAPGEGAELRRSIPFLAEFRVFNAQQLEGLPAVSAEGAAEPSFEPWPALERLLELHQPTIRHGGSRAYYSPSRDLIQLPMRAAFVTDEAYIGTVCHELGHWTGAPHRLNRQFGAFGSPDYAREELRAEWSAAMLSARLGVPFEVPQHASYLSAWRDVLKADRFEVIRAARDAQRIADYLVDGPRALEERNETQEAVKAAPKVAVEAAMTSTASSRSGVLERLRQRPWLPASGSLEGAMSSTSLESTSPR